MSPLRLILRHSLDSNILSKQLYVQEDLLDEKADRKENLRSS